VIALPSACGLWFTGPSGHSPVFSSPDSWSSDQGMIISRRSAGLIVGAQQNASPNLASSGPTSATTSPRSA
jgi:hypothetical protein